MKLDATPINVRDGAVEGVSFFVYILEGQKRRIMKFLSVRDLRRNSARVCRELLLEKEMIVTNNGKPVALLTAVNESNVEESLAAWRQARALQLISDIQTESVRRGVSGLTTAEIASEIAASRSNRA